MNKRNLVICDKEMSYAQGLGENVLYHKDFMVKTYICSDLKKVASLSKEKPIHLLVVDEKYAYEERCAIQAKQIFVLCKSVPSDLGKEEYAINKYQCADVILEKIFEVYTERTSEDLCTTTGYKESKIITIYSPIHRVGRTSFALALAKEYSKNRRTIYVNMEEYAGFEGAQQGGRNLGDLLYYIKQGNSNISRWIEDMVVKKDQLDYLLPIPISLDLREVTVNEWVSLLEELKQNSIYERVVLDIGECVQGVYQLLEQSDYIYMPILEDEISMQKFRRYENNLECLSLQHIALKTDIFIMPENICEYAKLRVKEEG